MNTKYFMFCLVNFMSFVNIHHFLSFRPANTFQKSWDSKAFTHFVMLPFLFTTLKRRLGTEDTKWWSVSGVILSHSSCKQVLRWATVTGSSLSHFALRCRNLRFILYWRQVGTAGRPVKYPYPLPPQPGLCNVCRMWFCIVLLKYAWTSLEKMSSWR